MHALHARLPKHFVLEERLERYADAIEPSPWRYAGLWAEAAAPLGAHGLRRFSEVRLDMGCGKGAFTVEAARREPDVLFVGVDFEPVCIAYAAQRAIESEQKNVVFAPGSGEKVTEYFGPGELSRIYLNFPTPFPRKKEAAERLTHLDMLMRYRQILGQDGSVILKTDSYPLWAFSRSQFRLAGYKMVWESKDTRSERPDDPESSYERRLTAKGASVYAIEAVPGPAPTEPVEQTAELSLAAWLPQDLEAMGYVPHGMEGTYTNIRNYEAKGGDRRNL